MGNWFFQNFEDSYFHETTTANVIYVTRILTSTLSSYASINVI